MIAYILCVRLVYHDQRTAPSAEGVCELMPATSGMTLRRALVGFGVAAAVILLVGPFMAEAAGHIADETGLGKTFVGSTLVAFSTSLPELVASLTALRMGAFDLAAGNIFGSNAFNMVLFVPLDLASPGPLLAGVSLNHAITGVMTMLVTSVAVMGQLYRVERRTWLIEPDALMVIALVIGTLALTVRAALGRVPCADRRGGARQAETARISRTPGGRLWRTIP